MGVSNTAPWSSWIQAQDANNLTTNYPLLLNPNGGSVGIGTETPRSIANFGSLGINGVSGAFTDYFLNGTRTGTTAVDVLTVSITPKFATSGISVLLVNL